MFNVFTDFHPKKKCIINTNIYYISLSIQKLYIGTRSETVDTPT